MDTDWTKQQHVEIFTWIKSKHNFELPPTQLTIIFQWKTESTNQKS